MAIANELYSEVKQILNYGESIRFKYYTVIHNSTDYYDDDITLIQSGTDTWCSGLIQPIDQTRGSADAFLLQQGKVLMNDSKLYVLGSVQTSGLGQIKVGIGSPNFEEYEFIDNGVIQWVVNGSPIYKKIYVRFLTNGSFIGE